MSKVMGDKLFNPITREGNGVMQTLDKMEQIIEGAFRVPISGKIMVDGHLMLELLDQLRAMLPAEIGEAQRLSKERERVLAEAAKRAQEIREAGNQEVERRLSDTEIVKLANSKAQEILRKAETVAQEIHSGAESYADELLSKMEITLEKSLAGIKQGRQELKNRRSRSA